MWSNNTEDTKIVRDQMEVFKILNGYENIDSNIFFSKLSHVKELEDMTSNW